MHMRTSGESLSLSLDDHETSSFLHKADPAVSCLVAEEDERDLRSWKPNPVSHKMLGIEHLRLQVSGSSKQQLHSVTLRSNGMTKEVDA